MVTMIHMEHAEHSKIIDRIGGTADCARICAVSSQAVSKWRREGIPEARLMYLRLRCPEAFVDSDQPAVVVTCGTSDPRHEDRRDGDRRDDHKQEAA